VSDAAAARSARFSPAWAVAAVAAGGVAAVFAAVSPSVALAVAAILVGIAAAALVFVRPQFGILLIIAALPLDTYGRVLTKPAYVTVYQLFLMLTLASWGWRLVTREERYRPSALDIGMGALFFAAVWSWPFSLDRATTSLDVVRIGFLWLFTALASHYLSQRRFADTALSVFLATVVAVSALALAQYLVPGLPIGNVHTQVSLEGAQLSRVAALYSDPNNLAGFVSVGVTAAAAVLVHVRRPVVFITAAIAFVLASAALVATYSRTGWIGAFVGLIAVVLTAPPKLRLKLVMAGIAVVVAASILAPGVIADRVASVVDYRRDESVATRVYMFGSAARMAEDYWQFGTGLGGFSQVYQQYRNPLALPYIVKPHEVPLALVAEAGVAGLIAVVLLTGSIIWIFFVARAGPWTYLQSAALAGVVALGLQSLFQYYLYFEYVWLFAALGVGAARLSEPRREVPS
jgi:O-antigen ligase